MFVIYNLWIWHLAFDISYTKACFTSRLRWVSYIWLFRRATIEYLSYLAFSLGSAISYIWQFFPLASHIWQFRQATEHIITSFISILTNITVFHCCVPDWHLLNFALLFSYLSYSVVSTRKTSYMWCFYLATSLLIFGAVGDEHYCEYWEKPTLPLFRFEPVSVLSALALTLKHKSTCRSEYLHCDIILV